MNLSNMSAYASQINLKLLADIISFVAATAKANYAQMEGLRKRCIFPLPSASEAMQQDYGFLYLGELLERYEERFGMVPPDRRAIALALGYTKDIATPEMFVGAQRADFIQGVRRCAENDIYLIGALYLIHGGESTTAAIEQRLKDWTYTRTEELVFAMSLFPDAEQALAQFSGQLVNLLGKGRTLPVFGNTDILNCAFVMLYPLKKRMKARAMDLLRALLSLPVSFVRADSKHYGWLVEHGYSPIEIVYANAAALCSHCVPDGPWSNSLTAEKLIVSLFRTVLTYDKPLPAEVYEQLSQIYQKYASFEIKCYGEHRLSDTLRGDLHIQTPETMAWFIGCTGEPLHPATAGFDIMDSRWDSLAGSLASKDYIKLFESCLTEDMDAGQIQQRLDRYRILTKQNYLDRFSKDAYSGEFSLMVNTGIIDLWTAFQRCLSEDGHVTDAILLKHIKSYCYNINSAQAFKFLSQFLHQYGYQGKKLYLDQSWAGFERELWAHEYSSRGPVTLSLQRDFLSDDPAGQRLLLHWVDEYFFTMDPKSYFDFVQAVLKDEAVAALLTPDDQRGIFDGVISQSEFHIRNACELKRRYLTQEEQQAVKEAAEAEKRRLEHLNKIQEIETYYANFNDGTFGFAVKYLNKYRQYDDGYSVASQIVRDRLEQLLQRGGHTMCVKEAKHFLGVCGDLICCGALGWSELQTYISRIKEVKRDDPGNDPSE